MFQTTKQKKKKEKSPTTDDDMKEWINSTSLARVFIDSVVTEHDQSFLSIKHVKMIHLSFLTLSYKPFYVSLSLFGEMF